MHDPLNLMVDILDSVFKDQRMLAQCMQCDDLSMAVSEESGSPAGVMVDN